MMRYGSLVALCVGCAGGSFRVRPGSDDSHVDTDVDLRDTDRPPDTDVGSPACTPHELAWRRDNAPEIGMFAGGAIAWHPTSGLRTWGGSQSDTAPAWEEGFDKRPWPIPSERWQTLFHSSDAPCMVHRDGSTGCRVENAALPQRVQTLGSDDNRSWWVDTDGQAGCDCDGRGVTWPIQPGEQTARVIAAGASWNPDHTVSPYLCALDAQGRATCTGPSRAVGVFEDPTRCWSELVASSYAICGLDGDGAIACTSSGPNDVITHVPSRRDLSHVSVSVGGACALDRDGRVVCWGYKNGDVVDVVRADAPLDTGFVDLAVDDRAACALSAAGRVKCWGFPNSSIVFDQPDVVQARR